MALQPCSVYSSKFDDAFGTTATADDPYSNGTLVGGAWFSSGTPLAGTTRNVSGVASYAVGTAATCEAVTSGATGAWSKLTSAQSAASIVLNNSDSNLDSTAIDVYQPQSINVLDAIIGLNNGGIRLRRE